MTQATIASKSHYCKLQLPLSLWEAVAERLRGCGMEVGCRDGWRAGRRRQTWAMQGWLGLSGAGNGGRCITSDISIPADAGLSLSCTHTQTHVSKLIEASSLAPHQAQRVMTVTLFLHQPPTFIITHA